MFGGADVYRATIRSRYFHRLYLTRIDAEFDCDSYFPAEINLDGPEIQLLLDEEVDDPRVPQGLQTDPATGVQYRICVYDRTKPS